MRAMFFIDSSGTNLQKLSTYVPSASTHRFQPVFFPLNSTQYPVLESPSKLQCEPSECCSPPPNTFLSLDFLSVDAEKSLGAKSGLPKQAGEQWCGSLNEIISLEEPAPDIATTWMLHHNDAPPHTCYCGWKLQ